MIFGNIVFYLDKAIIGIYGKAFLDLKNSVIYNL